MTDEKENEISIDSEEKIDHTEGKELENMDDTVDDVIHNITIQIRRLLAIQITQEEKADSFRQQIAEITNKMKAALLERARAIRIARKMNKLIS